MIKNTPYDKKLTAIEDKVVLRKVEKTHNMRKAGEIFIPQGYGREWQLCCADIESIGEEAKKEGIQVGMRVLYDPYSVFYDTHPIVVTKVENIIGIVPNDFNPNTDSLLEDETCNSQK